MGRRTVTLVAIAALMCAGLLTVQPMPAFAISTTPSASWMSNGKVYAMARVGPTLFIGGAFTTVRERPFEQGGQLYAAGRLAAIDLTTGAGIKAFTPDVTLTGGTAVVRSLAVSPDGSTLYVGGHFDAINGRSLRNLGAVDIATGAAKASFAQGRPPPVSFARLPVANGR